MDLDLVGKTALVTGSSKGLGRWLARSLYDEGCNVVVNGRNREAVDRVSRELGERASGIVADVIDPASCAELIREVGKLHARLDVLVCNVGSGRSVPPGEETPSEWKHILDINLASATNTVSAATGLMARTGGAIVCISSICGVEALGAPVTYSAAKAALNAYVRGVSRPLGRKGIRINAIAPGNLLFPGSVWERKLEEDAAQVEAMLEREVALRRLGTPEDIGSLTAFLASPRASFITGSVFVVDGGQLRS